MDLKDKNRSKTMILIIAPLLLLAVLFFMFFHSTDSTDEISRVNELASSLVIPEVSDTTETLRSKREIYDREIREKRKQLMLSTQRVSDQDFFESQMGDEPGLSLENLENFLDSLTQEDESEKIKLEKRSSSQRVKRKKSNYHRH